MKLLPVPKRLSDVDGKGKRGSSGTQVVGEWHQQGGMMGRNVRARRLLSSAMLLLALASAASAVSVAIQLICAESL